MTAIDPASSPRAQLTAVISEVRRRWRMKMALRGAALVVTLYRLGELDEALALFDEPIPRTANPRTIEKYRRLQRWVEDQIRQRAVSAQAP